MLEQLPFISLPPPFLSVPPSPLTQQNRVCLLGKQGYDDLVNFIKSLESEGNN